MIYHFSDVIAARRIQGYLPIHRNPTAQRLPCCDLCIQPFAVFLVSPAKQVDSGSQDTPCPNHPGSAQTIVVAVAVEKVEAAEMLGH
jgi:hypothetical protein